MPRFGRVGRYAAVVVAVLVLEAIVGGAGAAIFATLGIFNVAATAGHWPITHLLLHYVMERSMAAHAPLLTPPPLNDSVLILRGAKQFQAECALCHGAPDAPKLPPLAGMMPPAPPLYSVAAAFDPDELHWIVMHGIKFTAMPPWPAQDRNDEVWALVAFLKALRTMTPPDYQAVVSGSAGAAEAGHNAPAIPAAAAGCASCHGADGGGLGGAFPAIAGLDAGVIGRAVRDYRDGRRSSGFMATAVSGLDEPTIAAAASYFAALSPPAPAPANAALVAAGAIVAARSSGGPSCMTCHDSAGEDPSVPEIRGQSARIVADQLRLFRASPATDVSRASVASAHRLSDTDTDAVAAFFAQRPRR